MNMLLYGIVPDNHHDGCRAPPVDFQDRKNMARSKRFEVLAKRDVNKETFISEFHELGLVIMDSPDDPEPSLVLENGRIAEMDGRSASEFDAIDRFIAAHAINLDTAEKAMAMSSREIARMFVDINVPQKEEKQILS